MQSPSTPMHVTAAVAQTHLNGQLDLPRQARGVVLFPHGRGTSRGANDSFLASKLCEAGFGTFLLDLLTPEEADLDARKATFRFDTDLLAGRLALATDWLAEHPATRNLPIGYLGIGYTAAATLHAAAMRPKLIRAVVTHDAVADLADKVLPRVPAATLLIGGLSQAPAGQPGTKDKRFVEVPTLVAVHKPEEVARLAAEWFTKHLIAGVAEDNLLGLEEALSLLAADDPQKAELVKLRLYSGLSVQEAADRLGIARDVANRSWAYARAWLYDRLRDKGAIAVK